MIDTSFLDGLARFNLIVRKRVTSNYAGPRKSVAQGRGVMFKDHRIYAPGDDFRSIDWRVYARTDDLMVKNYEEEKNLVVHIIVDKSSSMDFGKLSKFNYASMLGVGYAYLAMKNNDKFQFSTFSDDSDIFQPKKGMSQVMAMIDYLNNLKLKGKTDLLGMAQKYRKIIGSRAMVVLISDFLVPIDEIRESLYYFREHELNLIQILDPIEMNLEMEGDFKLKDSESGKLIRAYLSLSSRNAYLEQMGAHSASIENECNAIGANFSQISTDTDIFDAFYRVLK